MISGNGQKGHVVECRQQTIERKKTQDLFIFFLMLNVDLCRNILYVYECKGRLVFILVFFNRIQKRERRPRHEDIHLLEGCCIYIYRIHHFCIHTSSESLHRLFGCRSTATVSCDISEATRRMRPCPLYLAL
jgi:hypothetical protein